MPQLYTVALLAIEIAYYYCRNVFAVCALPRRVYGFL